MNLIATVSELVASGDLYYKQTQSVAGEQQMRLFVTRGESANLQKAGLIIAVRGEHALIVSEEKLARSLREASVDALRARLETIGIQAIRDDREIASGKGMLTGHSRV